MSLETALAENTKALTALAEVNLKVVANQERLLAGQNAAIEKLEGAKNGKPATTRKPADAAPKPKEVSDDEVKAAGMAFMAAITKGKPEAEAKEIKQKVGSPFLAALLEHFGVGGKLSGPDSKLNAEQRKQAKFYLERKAAGLSVDLNAEYDFDGDVKQGGAEPEGEEDPLG